MFQPPLFIRLTRYDTNQKEYFLVSLIHRVFTDERGFTVLLTLHACDRGVAEYAARVKESEEQVMAKLGKISKKYLKQLQSLNDDDDWNSGQDSQFSIYE